MHALLELAHYLLLAVCGGWGLPVSRIPRNSGPSSLAADVKVESRVDKDSVMKMMLVTEYKAVPKYLETAVGLPANKLAYIAAGTLQYTMKTLPNCGDRGSGDEYDVRHTIQGCSKVLGDCNWVARKQVGIDCRWETAAHALGEWFTRQNRGFQ